jgi:hypothetical protein
MAEASKGNNHCPTSFLSQNPRESSLWQLCKVHNFLTLSEVKDCDHASNQLETHTSDKPSKSLEDIDAIFCQFIWDFTCSCDIITKRLEKWSKTLGHAKKHKFNQNVSSETPPRPLPLLFSPDLMVRLTCPVIHWK